MLSGANLPPKNVVQRTYLAPFEAWKKKRPCVSHLRVLGCMAYAHVPKDEHRKLDSKTRKCILVGYGEETKEYRFYNPNKRRITNLAAKQKKGAWRRNGML